MQLEACLRSIRENSPYGRTEIRTLYRATNAGFEDGYRQLELNGGATFVRESNDFRRDLLGCIDATVEQTVFHTDDDVFYRRVDKLPSVPSELAAFSLRLGLNTTYCFTSDRPQPIPSSRDTGTGIIWDWTRAQADFSYPMSLDGHIFPTKLLLRMLARARFSNPNELEEELHFRRFMAPPFMAAFRESCLLSIPANIVTETHQNRVGADPALTPEALNDRFLAGDRIDLDAMDFSQVRGAHQEIPLRFTGSR